MIIDTHCHILDSRFAGDRNEAIARATDNGVAKLIEIGCAPADWKEVLSFAEKNHNIFCALGIHPQDANSSTDILLSQLSELAAANKVVGIGETGLDYFYENSPREIQKIVFSKHIALATVTGKPLVIHCRQAYEDLILILEAELSVSKKISGVIHCFSGTLEEALKLIAMGFIIGIDGPVTYPNAKVLKDAIKVIPLDKIILETDSPYLPPQLYRGSRNEPSYLPLIAEEISKIKQIPVETVREITTNNAINLFNI